MYQGPRIDTDRSTTPDEVREELQRILASRIFNESHRMSRFLQFVVDRTLAGQGQSLKEYLIGVEVFDRKASYDPRVDPIVRVEARRLRSKLAEYYKSEGRDSVLRIDLPTGTYVPSFVTPGTLIPAERTLDKTIAVLPFTDLSPGQDSDYFSDGLTEELTHVLTKVPQLRVVSWNSAAMFKGRQTELTAAVEQLAADVVLRGSVRRSGGRLRIMAQLLEAKSGLVLWSESYDRQFEDIFTVQGEIALAIANALQLQLLQPPQERPATPSALHAYNLYLLGRYYWNSRRREHLLKSVEYFQQAIAADPRNPLAHVGLADAYTILADQGAVAPDTLRVAEEAARRAMQLDPRMAEPYATIALMRSNHDWRWAESEALYQRAIQLNHNCTTARHWFGIDLLAMMGRFEEAERELLTARRLDPLSSIIPESTGYLYMMWGRFEEAAALYRELFRRCPEFTRTYGSMGRLHTQRGEYARAIELFECGLSQDPDTPSMLAALGQTWALSGRHDQALSVLSKLTALSAHRHFSGTCFAVVYIGMGDTDQALDWLERAADRRDAPVTAIGVHPVYDPLRNLTRFRELLRRIQLEPAEKRAMSYRKTAQ